MFPGIAGQFAGSSHKKAIRAHQRPWLPQREKRPQARLLTRVPHSLPAAPACNGPTRTRVAPCITSAKGPCLSSLFSSASSACQRDRTSNAGRSSGCSIGKTSMSTIVSLAPRLCGVPLLLCWVFALMTRRLKAVSSSAFNVKFWFSPRTSSITRRDLDKGPAAQSSWLNMLRNFLIGPRDPECSWSKRTGTWSSSSTFHVGPVKTWTAPSIAVCCTVTAKGTDAGVSSAEAAFASSFGV
mmetsp:Transcript_73297/g.170017  ORF Transcript_73297/g.170017 Transcript_73297/m.170017 type:complete len:240 (-) Transcript_73297:355-1074(-)